MFRFEEPSYLWLLCTVPVLVAVWLLAGWRRRKNLARIGQPDLLKTLMPDVSDGRRTFKFCLVMAAIALMAVILARPQRGSKVATDNRNGIETVIAIDVSNSMLAEDVAPSRLEKSKMLVENLIDKFVNDKIGLVVFAGDAFVQMPISCDYMSAKMFLESINPSQIATQGTDIARAIRLSSMSFTQQPNIGRAIILITDGEDHEGQAMEAAKEANKKGINVFILGIGDPKGAPIPVGGGEYMRDDGGKVVMTALNENMCRDLAKAGKGTYIHVDNTNDAQERLDRELSALQKGETMSVVYSEYAEQFQAFAIIVLLLLIIEVCVLERSNQLVRKMGLFSKKRFVILALLSLSFAASFAQSDRSCIRKGNRVFRQQQYAKSEAEFAKAVELNPDNPQAHYNLGCAYMMQEKDSAAVAEFELAGSMEKNRLRRSMSFHNIGVICQNRRLYSDAINAYKESLRDNPGDNETRYNLVLCMRQLKKQQDGQKKQQQEKQKQKEEEDKKQQQQQQQQQQQPQQQQQQQQENMSRENAEQLLNAAMQNEQDTRRKVDDAMRRMKSRRLQKNW